MSFNSVLNLSLLNGSNGFAINGINPYDYSGHSVSNAGDINGDGRDDLIIGAQFADSNGRYDSGQSYVVFGSTTPFASSLNLSTLNGSNGFVINGVNAYDWSGFSVSNAGDINSDDTDDLIIGANYADTDGKNALGQSYVVFGSTTPFASSFNLSSLNGSNGFVINGINAYDYSGVSVSNAGDINGDDTDDLIIGAWYADPNDKADSGQSYVVFGSTTPFASSFNLSNINGSNGFAFNGIKTDDRSGVSVSNAGDINDDGRDDLIIGAFRADSNNKNDSGQTYVVFGSTNHFASSFNLSTLNGSNGFAINGMNVYDGLGISLGSAGDINGDGRDDLIIGATGADPNGRGYSGQSYVVFGSTNPFASSFNLSSLNGSNGFAINGINAYDGSGISVSSAGDINGDGRDDLIIGANYAHPDRKSRLGQSYVVFGSTTPFAKSFNLSSLNGSNGFIINGINAGDLLGISVSSAGDINDDGRDDLIIGAIGAESNGSSNSGQSYVVFGQDTIEGDNNNNLLNGTSNNETILGLGGNDTLKGLAGDDSIDGGTDNDLLNGGFGNDIYVVDNTGDIIQETSNILSEIDTAISTIKYTLGANVENLILIGNSNIQGNGNSLNNKITGNNGDNILNGGFGYDTLSGGLGNDSFRFNNGVPFDTKLAFDRIIDFTNNSDTIALSKKTFTAITSNLGTGFSNTNEIAQVNSYTEAQSSSAVIVYNTTNDRLFYNQNGTAPGFGTGAAFTELLGNTNLGSNDFSIIT